MYMYLLRYNLRSCTGIHQFPHDDRLSPEGSRFNYCSTRATSSETSWNLHPGQIIIYRRDSYPHWHIQEPGRSQRKHRYTGRVWYTSSLHSSSHINAIVDQ